MVDPETFEEARLLLAKAIEEAYQDSYLIPPIEVSPGHWFFWPIRKVELKLEETRYWEYGKPWEGTGNLQAHLEWPYGNHDRIKPRPDQPFGKKEAERAAKLARSLSDNLGRRDHHLHFAAQEAYIAGYEAVEDASEEGRQGLWRIREDVYRYGRADRFLWDRLHGAIRTFLEMKPDARGVLDWLPQEYERESEWTSLKEELGESRLYDLAMWGVLHALDDWAVKKGLLVENEAGNRVIPE